MLAAIAAAAAAAAAASARWNWWRPRIEGLPVLMYHKIGSAPAGARLAKLWVSPRALRRQLDYLKRGGWTPLLFSELQAAESGRGPMPAKPVLITFDDGHADNRAAAFPILREYGMKANIFLIVEALARGSWRDPAGGPEAPMLSWAQVLEMRDSGGIEFGSHTLSHADLARAPTETARREVFESKRLLESRLGRPVLGFAYPYGSGALDPRLRDLVREAGYRYDFSIKQGISPRPWDPARGPLRRLLIRGDDSMLDFHLNLTRGRSRL
ncbi:MAG: polysaccharide deacetylase family protein [Elusimicrobia bacterium]|nr:polysaccharide deacetylase family protein [Elusimicrobiota bacterium]